MVGMSGSVSKRVGGCAKSMCAAAQDQNCRTGERIVGAATTGQRDWIDRNGRFSRSGLDYPRVSVVTDCPHMRINLSATGRFVTIFPASAFRFLTESSEIKVLPVELPRARRPNSIVTLKNRALSPVAKLFVNCAREVAKP